MAAITEPRTIASKNLRLFIEQALDGFVLVNEKGLIVEWNPAAERISGIKSDLVLGLSFVEVHSKFIPYVDASQVSQKELLKIYKVFQKTGQLPWLNRVIEFSRPEAPGRFFQLHTFAIRSTRGFMLGIILRDITENKRQISFENEQRALAEALRDSAIALNSTLELDEVLDRILSSVIKVVPHDAANIMLVEGGNVRIVGCRGYEAQGIDKNTMLATRYSIPETHNFRNMIETKYPVLNNDTRVSSGWRMRQASAWIRSYLGAPIIVKGEVVGFINLDSATPGFFDENMMHRLQAFADQAAVAVQNARLYRSLRLQAEETAALYRALTPLLNPGSDLEALAEQIVEAVVREFASTHASVLLVNEESFELQVTAQAGYSTLKGLGLPLDGSGITVKAARTGEVIYEPNVNQNALYISGSSQTNSELAIPLVVNDRVLGILNLESPLIDAFNSRAQRILVNYANRVALAVENASLFKEIEQHDRQIALLNEITHVALACPDLDSLLQNLTDRIAHTYQADSCAALLWDSLNQNPHVAAASGEKRIELLSFDFEQPEVNLFLSTLETEHALAIESENDSPFISPLAVSTFPYHSLLFLPLIADDQELGVLLIAFNILHHFTSKEIAFGEQVAAQVALALARAQSATIAEKRLQETENLRQAAASMSSSLNLKQVLDSILSHLEKVIAFDSACMFILEGDLLRAEASKNIPNIIGQSMPGNDPLLEEAEKLGKPLLIKDVRQDSRFTGWGGATRTRGWMGVALKGRTGIIGWLTLDSFKIGGFTEEHTTLAQTFASQAAIAIENAKLYAALQQRAVELESLYTATTALVSTLDLQELMERILSTAVRAIPVAAKGALLMYEAETRTLHVRATFGYQDPRVSTMSFSINQGYAAKSIRLRKPILIRDIQEDDNLRYYGDISESGNILSAIAVPLILEDHVLGVLTLDSTIEDAFKEEHLRLLSGFASTVTIAIHNAQLHAEVQEMAVTDPLTGLYNRRGFFEVGLREANRSARSDTPLSAIMADADYMKQINDAYGHDAGDKMLKSIANIFRNGLRRIDIICRYGGDEFAVLLPDTNLALAVEIAERLRRNITDSQIETGRGQVNLSTTIGVAAFDEDCATLDALLKRADQALYAAKERGRNRVMQWDPSMKKN